MSFTAFSFTLQAVWTPAARGSDGCDGEDGRTGADRSSSLERRSVLVLQERDWTPPII